MAKLPANVQEAAQKAEPSAGFAPVPAGIYRLKCTKATLSKPNTRGDGTNAEWELNIDQEGVRKARLWMTVSHSPEAAGLMHMVFHAFGLTLDSDSDEFIGEHCLGDIIVEQQTVGRNAGRDQNKITSLMPLDGAVAASMAASNGAQQPAGAAAGAAPAADPWA